MQNRDVYNVDYLRFILNLASCNAVSRTLKEISLKEPERLAEIGETPLNFLTCLSGYIPQILPPTPSLVTLLFSVSIVIEVSILIIIPKYLHSFG